MGGIGGAISALGSADAQSKADMQDAHNQLDLYWDELNKANQVDASMTQHLTSSLADVNAVRAASGAEMVSPSGEAVKNRILGLANQDINRRSAISNRSPMKTSMHTSSTLRRRPRRTTPPGSASLAR
jgi:uncharacterized membrane-anchored protein YhcB (DUF1043 family)